MIALLLLACGAAQPPPPQPTPPPAAEIPAQERPVSALSDLNATVTAERTDATVVFTWTLQNQGEGAVWLADRLLTNDAGGARLAVDRGVVRQPPAETAPVRITVGYTAPYAMPMRELMPAVRELAAGAQTTGRVVVPLPPTSYHPLEEHGTAIDRLPGPVVVAIGVFTTPPETSPIPLGSGETVPTLARPSVRSQQWIELEADWPTK